jgi:PST family polysaccharide transporter
MITSLISVKIVANLIGPSGIALVGQLNNFSQIMMNLSNGGLIAGIIKYISEHKEDEEKCKSYISTGIRITVGLSILISIMLILFSGKLSEMVFQSREYRSIILLLGCTLVFFALNTFLTALLNGFQEYTKFVSVNIIGSICGLLFSVTLAIVYGLKGALIASVTNQSAIFFITLLLIRKSRRFAISNFTGKFHREHLRKLGNFSIMAIVSTLTVPTSQLLARGFITKFHSAHEAGLWEGVNRISGIYLMVITTSLGVYFLPRISQLKTREEIQTEVRTVYKLMLPFLVFSSVMIYFLRYIVIQILFSSEFYDMESLFATQMAAESIKICGFLLGYILMAKAMTKKYVYLEIQNFVLLLGLNYFLVREYGAIGSTISFLIAYSLYLIMALFLLKGTLFSRTQKTEQDQ